MNIRHVGDGKVVLIAGGNKIYTDIAARFVRSERDLEEIIASPYDKNIVQNILQSHHLAATEFDYFIFGIEGYSRVTETQLVRKRIASYLIKSGRCELHNKRQFDVVYPKSLDELECNININNTSLTVTAKDIIFMLDQFYDQGLQADIPEEDLRYLKPQATTCKAIIGMNAHALMDWFRIRCCKNAQAEIRDLAFKMLRLCKEAAPDLFKDAGPSCKVLGYCPENKYQNKSCQGKIPTHDEVKKYIQQMKESRDIIC